jgi:hypothetical protein
LPGQVGKTIRNEQADIAARSVAGCSDLEAALPHRRADNSADTRAALMQGLESSHQVITKEEADKASNVRMLKWIKK